MTKILLSILAIVLCVSVNASASEKLEIVKNDKVCMVTNMLFARTQIPVVHEGKTYYGCCANCKKTLAEDPEARVAKDPVSGKDVDKATAVIAAREDGSVVYFENKNTFEEFTGKSKKSKAKKAKL